MDRLSQTVSQLNKLDTEAVNPKTTEIDRLSALEIATLINDEDRTVADVVQTALPALAEIAEHYAATLASGHRVFYVGAGTSGRLGVLDAAECPPTFGSDPDQIVGLISGGYATMVLSLEGVEDDEEAAISELVAKGVTRNDLVIGLAASTRTPFTQAALRHAIDIGSPTAFIVCNKVTKLELAPRWLVELPVGPEVVAGSTRMKSGTAQKMALNVISTTAMVRLGKTFGNRMVDLQARSEKLAARSRKILIDIFDIPFEDANQLLHDAGHSVKTAIAMRLLVTDRATAEARLADVDGHLHRLEPDNPS